MKIRSKQISDQLTVNLEDVSNPQEVIETIEACKDGNCACSTDEYQKVQSIEIQTNGNSMTLNVEVKPGEVIDPQCISDCLCN